ncbi:MAG: 23S rRNA (uracil(1939)-C(5))-methyltransferase RlmD [Deltaproteobacteria bacterium]|nr:23S rRNA (uracil(1939)-C(5))-methyltransferase RlmD [Deltaproteobacteria bacterium]
MTRRRDNQNRASFSARVGPLELGQDCLQARAGNRSFSVAPAVVGDQLRLRPTRRDGVAQIIELIRPSADRSPAPCGVLAHCGACSIQQMSYAAQLAAKQSALIKQLAALGCAEQIIGQILAPPSPFGYRTRLLMPADQQQDKLCFGLYQRGTARLVPAEGCPVQHPLTLAVLAGCRQLLASHEIQASSVGGWLHALGVRVDPHGQQAQLLLCTTSPKVPAEKTLVAQLLQLPGVFSVHLTAQAERSSYPVGPEIKHLGGGARMPFHIAGKAFLLSPATFVQTSAWAANTLGEQVLALLPEHFDRLADLYGGAGIFAQLAYGRYRQGWVVEENPSAIADLQQMIKQQALSAIRASRGRVEQRVEQLTRFAPDVAIVDPPRQGCKPPAIAALCQAKPTTLIYVACGFEALLRDGQRLLEAGYRVDAVRALDMFPHTPQLEVIMRFVAEKPAR